MDYKQCLKVHGYIANNSDSENESSNVEEIYNKYKPPPVPYDEFKHRVITIYADSSTASQSNNRTNSSCSSSSSNTFRKVTPTVNPSGTVQRNRLGTPHVPAVARPASNVHSMLQQQQQLDQFANSYRQRTDTPIRDILTRPSAVRAPARVQVPRPPVQPARVYTVTPPPAAAAVANIPTRSTSSWTERRAAHSNRSVQPTRPPAPSPSPPSDDIEIPYQPLVASEPTRHRRPRTQPQQQQQHEEEEQNNCCCCIC